tara:strand:+ start:115 stop:657 length:543 start_codon:yes stop_codon:yes gene_type:complete
MKKLLLLLILPLLWACQKEEPVILEPTFELTLNDNIIDTESFYRVINTYGGIKTEDGVTTKLFVLYLQRDEGNPRLNSEHFAVILKDTNAIDNGILLDIGTYDHLGTDSKQTSLEIPGPDDYIVQATSLVQDIHNGLICLDASGEFWNPYQQAFYTVTAKLENYPIGQDVESTPYGYLLD